MEKERDKGKGVVKMMRRVVAGSRLLTGLVAADHELLSHCRANDRPPRPFHATLVVDPILHTVLQDLEGEVEDNSVDGCHAWIIPRHAHKLSSLLWGDVAPVHQDRFPLG